MGTKKKFSLRILGIFATVFVAFILVLFSAFHIFLFTKWGQDFLSDQLTQNLSQNGYSIEIGEITGQAPSPLKVKSLMIKDKQGKLVSLKGLEIDWSPYALLKGELTIRKLAAEEIILHRVPESPEPKAQKPQLDFALPAPPLGFSIAEFNIPHLDLTPLFEGYAKRPFIFGLHGKDFGYAYFSSLWQGKLEIKEQYAKGSRLLVELETKPAKVNLSLKDEGQGVLSVLSQHPQEMISFQLAADREKRDWKGQIDFHFGNQFRNHGDFTIDRDHQTEGHFLHLAAKTELGEGLKGQFPLFTENVFSTKLDLIFRDKGLILKTFEMNTSEFESAYRGNLMVSEDQILAAGDLSFLTLQPLSLSPDTTFEVDHKAKLTLRGDWNALDLNLDAAFIVKNRGSLDHAEFSLKTHAELLSFLNDLKANITTQARLDKIEGDFPVKVREATLDIEALYAHNSKTLALKHLKMIAPGAQLEGSLLFEKGEIQKTAIKGGIQDVSEFVKDDSGISGQVDIDIKRASPREALTAQIFSKSLKLGAVPLDPLTAEFIQLRDDIVVHVKFGPEVNPILMKTVIQKGPDFIRFADIQIDDTRDKIFGDFVYDTKKNQYEGFLKGGITRFGPLTKLLGSKSGKGKIFVDCKVKPREESTYLDLLLKLQDFEMKDLYLKLGIIKAELEATTAGFEGQLNTTLFDGAYQDWQFKQIMTTLHGNKQNCEYDLIVKSLMPLAASFETSGRFEHNEEGFTKISLNALTGRVLEKKVEIVDPIELTRFADETSLSPCQMMIGRGTLSAYLRKDDKAFDAYVKAEHVPLGLLSGIDPRLMIDGGVTGEVSLSGDVRNPRAKIDLKLSEVDFAMNNGVEGKFFGEIAGGLLDKKLQVKGQLQAEKSKGNPLVFTALSSLDFSSGSPVFNEEAPFQSKVQGDLNLADFLVFWPLENDAIEGHVHLDCRATGSLNDLKFGGQIDIENGYYGNGDFGTELKDFSCQLHVNQDELFLDDLLAYSDKGKLQGKGRLKLREDFPYLLDLKMKDYPIIMNDEMEFVGNVDLKAQGGGNRIDSIKGRIDLSNATYTLPKDISSELKDIFDVEEESDQQHFSNATLMDIDVNLSQPLLIKGWGIESTWRGGLNIGGNLGKPTFAGKVELRQGEFKLLGPVFKMTKGEITFVPGESSNPFLDIRAETQKDDVTAIITIIGNSASPKLSLLSQPELPQEEILSRILFSESTANLSPYQAVKIASIAGSFGGIKIPLLGQLESISSTLGFDSFEIGAGASGGTAPVVKFGKRISNRVKASFEEDVEQRKTQGKLEVELTPHIILESGVSSGGSSGSAGNLGIVGKWEY